MCGRDARRCHVLPRSCVGSGLWHSRRSIALPCGGRGQGPESSVHGCTCHCRASYWRGHGHLSLARWSDRRTLDHPAYGIVDAAAQRTCEGPGVIASAESASAITNSYLARSRCCTRTSSAPRMRSSRASDPNDRGPSPQELDVYRCPISLELLRCRVVCEPIERGILDGPRVPFIHSVRAMNAWNAVHCVNRPAADDCLRRMYARRNRVERSLAGISNSDLDARVWIPSIGCGRVPDE